MIYNYRKKILFNEESYPKSTIGRCCLYFAACTVLLVQQNYISMLFQQNVIAANDIEASQGCLAGVSICLIAAR